MAIKVTKGQISDGTISKNTCHVEYYLFEKFHSFMKKCTMLSILGATPLYYYGDLTTLDLALDIYCSGFNSIYYTTLVNSAISSYIHTQSRGSDAIRPKLFYDGNYQTLGDKLYACSIRVFYTKISGFKRLREQVMGKGCHFGRFLSNTWLTVSELNQSWCVSSFLMGVV